MSTTNIEWTDTVWNPVRGCTRVSPGCQNCYAERQAIRFTKTGMAYEGLVQITNGHPQWTGKVVCDSNKLDEPLRWKKPRRVFVNSMSDLFHETVPDSFIDSIVAVMALCREHTFQVLTKRAERMQSYLANMQQRADEISTMITRTTWWESESASPCAGGTIEDRISKGPLPNVLWGTSIENQQAAEERIRPGVQWLSVEPMLGRVNLHLGDLYCDHLALEGLGTGDVPYKLWRCSACGGLYRWLETKKDHGVWVTPFKWVVCGGESGPGARPFNLVWASSILQQCRAAGIPFFMKQIGSYPATITGTGLTPLRYNCVDRKGGDPEEWPELLRVREFPAVRG